MEREEFKKTQIGTVFKFGGSEKWEQTGAIIVKVSQTKLIEVESLDQPEGYNGIGDKFSVEDYYCFLFKAPKWIQEMFT